MASLAGRMPEFREVVFGILGETAVIAGNEVKGKFYNRYREIDYQNGTIVGLDISFDCQWRAFMATLNEGDALTVEGASYRFLRRIPDAGDESGKVTLELGSAAT